MTLSDEQKKIIEQEAKVSSKEYYIGGSKDFEYITFEDGFINGATAYATLCIQKDEEIARLRSALGRIEQYSDSGNYATAIVEMKVIATEALKQ